MNKFKNWFKREYVLGWNWFDYTFLFGLLAVQTVICFILFDTGLGLFWNIFSLIASFVGTLATIICAKGKMSYYIWGFIQTGMFLVLNVYLRLWVESAEQLYYLITMAAGVFIWKKNINNKSQEINSKKLNKKQLIITISSLLIASVGIYFLDKYVLNGNQPLLDTMSLSIAIIANILCSLCYKEQWYLWFVLDIIQTIMYFLVGNYVLGIMYIGWTINCIYGYYQWSKKKEIELGEMNVGLKE